MLIACRNEAGPVERMRAKIVRLALAQNRRFASRTNSAVPSPFNIL